MRHLTRLYNVVAFAAAAIGLGEQFYNRYTVIKRKRKRAKTPFGFHT